MNITDIIRKLTGRGSSNAFSSGCFAAVDWTGTSISVQEFALSGTQISIAAEVHAQWPEGSSPDQSVEAAAAWLAAELQRSGITATNAVVCVPRRHVSLKLLEFPVVSDDELASLVMLQIESRMDGQADEQACDFLPLPTAEDASHRHVLLATIAQSKLDQIQQVMTAAGLTLKATSVGELTIDSLLPDQTGLTLNILANHAKAEIVVSHNGCPVASHAVAMPKNNPAALASSLPDIQARLIATLPESLAVKPVRQMFLLGPNAGALHEHVAKFCNGNLQVINTQCDNSIRTLSLMTGLNHGATPINFLHPRRPTDEKAARRIQMGRYAAGIAVLCGLIGYWIHDQKASLETQLATLKQSQHNLEELNERGQSVLEAWQYVNQWQSSSANWSNELHAFTEHLPEIGKMYLTQLQLEQPAGTEQAVLRADGLAKESEIAMALNRKLMASDGKYELQPNGIEPSARDTDFRSAFRVDLTIQQQTQGSSQ